MTQAITSLKDRFEQVTRPAREKLQSALLAMTPRDRALLAGLVAFVVVALFLVGGLTMSRSLGQLRALLVTRQGQVAMIDELLSTYNNAAAKKGDIDKQLEAHKDTTVSAYLEKAADKVQIRDNLKQVKERSTTVTGDLEEKQYSVNVSRISLDQLGSFLYEIEASGYPMRIRSARVKTLVISGAKTLDATLEISGYRIVTAATEATP